MVFWLVVFLKATKKLGKFLKYRHLTWDLSCELSVVSYGLCVGMLVCWYVGMLVCWYVENKLLHSTFKIQHL
ncbi:hypothetical protein IMCC3317_05210 [Kordia antarctica]|uniref:Uncharacterized protein n=1 Tax=Kordia antarctica TaxID=1218801 RepID=A0A7L4ZEZ2_9FLAO|nr:hypothetical protein IMCC3317_05210 [Kordia antarctica]